MTQQEAIQQHQKLCDELYQLALEENRFLQQHHRPPEAPLLDRKRSLLARLDQTLTALRAAPAPGTKDSARKDALEKTRSRILQILQIDRENEQLLLRSSLPGRGTSKAVPGMLQKIYQQHT
jgi:hypothetical protein